MRETLRRLRNRGLWQPPGHYYSPIPSKRDITRPVPEPVGIAWRHDQQTRLADEIEPHLRELPKTRSAAWRWHAPNNMFGQPDAGTYYGILAKHRPSKVVEVGSGFSTAIALDAVERHNLTTELVCVEPYPQRLKGLLRPGDQVSLIDKPVQEVPVDTLADLRPGDVLFVDSTHVVKTGSDVVHLLLHVVPSLRPGVVVHVHDIHWPFVYPRRWLEEGRAWNETYLVQALLVGGVLDVMLWGSYLAATGRSEFAGAGSIWMRKR